MAHIDLTDGAKKPKASTNKERTPQQTLNKTPELIANANAFVSKVFPKTGKLILGEAGMEFRADSGCGFIQIPWKNIELVRADVYTHYVRSIDVITDGNQTLPFVLSHGVEVLRCIRDHIGRDKIVDGQRNVQTAADKIFHKHTHKDV